MIPETVDSDLPVIVTEPFDMLYAGQKTLSSIETDAAVVSDPEAGADCTFDNNSWTLANYKDINNQGIATVSVAGNSFRACIRFGAIYNNTRISYLKVRFKMTDLRGIRGVYAPPTSFRGQGA
jgi:archaellum component FlaG (FlaF/FlaG flagellin family)